MSTIEDRVREAFRTRADAVTEDDLVRRYPAPDLGPERRSRRGAWVAAAAAAAVVVGTVWATTSVGRRAAVPATTPTGTVSVAPTSASPTPSASSSPSATPTDRELPLSAVPWSEVGPGWVVATVRRGPYREHPQYDALLVSPFGTRYLVGTGIVEDATADGSRLLWRKGDTLSVQDLRTGQERVVATNAPQEAHFTRPDGTSVILVYGQDTPDVQVGLDGTVQRKLPALSVLRSSPSGAHLAGVAPTHLVTVLDTSSGAVLRTIAPPDGFDLCVLKRWDTDSDLVLSCESSSPASQGADVFRYSVPDGTLHRITRGHSPDGGSGFADAIHVGDLVLAKPWDPTCQPTPLRLLGPDGTSTTALPNLPDRSGGWPLPVTSAGGTVIVWYAACGDASVDDGLYSYDPTSEHAVQLVPTGPEVGSVVGVVPLGR